MEQNIWFDMMKLGLGFEIGGNFERGKGLWSVWVYYTFFLLKIHATYTTN